MTLNIHVDFTWTIENNLNLNIRAIANQISSFAKCNEEEEFVLYSYFYIKI